ncbi:MAG: response regulator [Chthoniobacteraceae bacterium]
MLLEGLLEAAGYAVQTTVDGMEAYSALREGTYDLVISDVEMPRLNGFDLTARTRVPDRKLEKLPVILVTALETREDRERGIDAGANAYVVKSNFDQSNLLEIIRRLVSAGTSPARKKIKVLVVDDSRVARQLLAHLLEADPENCRRWSRGRWPRSPGFRAAKQARCGAHGHPDARVGRL